LHKTRKARSLRRALFSFNNPLLVALGNTEIVGLKWLSLRNLSADGGQVSFVNRARPTKKSPLFDAGHFIFQGLEHSNRWNYWLLGSGVLVL
jgi:hypothetical protein